MKKIRDSTMVLVILLIMATAFEWGIVWKILVIVEAIWVLIQIGSKAINK